jgi:hypothetical protein
LHLSSIGIIITLSILLSTSVIIRQITFAKVQSFTDSNFDTLYANPGAYANSQANITAKVFSLPSSDVGSKKVLQVYQGGNSDTNVLVGYNYTGVRFDTQHCVRIVGITGDTVSYRTLFGGNLTALPIKAQSVKKIDCMFVYEPPKKTVIVEKTQEQQGIRMTLHKVEFSDKNTRAYLTIENLNKTGSEDLNFRDSDSIAIQGKTQFGTTTGSSDVKYKNIKTTIPPGIEENGVVLFEPLNYTYPTAEFRFKAGVGYGNDQTFKFPIQLH